MVPHGTDNGLDIGGVGVIGIHFSLVKHSPQGIGFQQRKCNIVWLKKVTIFKS